MIETLLDAACRHARAHADADGIARTPIAGLAIVRETVPSPLRYGIQKPLIALVLQGRKRVGLGSDTLDLGAGESLLITAAVPTVSQITRATAGEPYVSLVLDLDMAVIEGLAVEMGAASSVVGAPIRVDHTDTELADAAGRLLRLFDRPEHLSVLRHQLIREMHFWLLSGRHGAAIRSLGAIDSHARRVARALALIQADFARSIRVEELAETAGMSPSSFHEHFRAITALTPLQYQKRLRLIEARRMMLADGATVGHAAYEVGYESVPQFTREYGRFFGMSPARDIKAAKSRMRPAA